MDVERRLVLHARTRPKFAPMAKRASCDIISRSNVGHGRCGRRTERIGHVELRVVSPIGPIDPQLVAEGLGEPLAVKVPTRFRIGQGRDFLNHFLHHRGHLQDQRRMRRRHVVGRAVELRPAKDVGHHGRDPIDRHEILAVVLLDPQGRHEQIARRRPPRPGWPSCGQASAGRRTRDRSSCSPSANRRR